MTKMKAYPSFAAWQRDQSREHQRLIESLSRLVRKVAPEFDKAVKWGQGCWVSDGDPRVFIHAEPDHLQFGFYRGSALTDPDGLLVGKGKFVRHVKVFDSSTVPRKSLAALVEQVR